MKKTLTILLTITILLSFSSCALRPTTQGIEETTAAIISGVPNPMTEVESLEALSSMGQFALVHASNAMNEKYFTYSTEPTMYEYQFELAGIDCSVRFSTDKENDISGIYGKDGLIFSGNTEDNAYYEDESFKALRWFFPYGQYVLSVNDGGQMTKEDFDKLAEQFTSLK